MSTVSLTCSECGASFERDLGEYNFAHNRGNDIFFCSKKCSIKALHRTQAKEKIIIEKVCPVCNNIFKTEIMPGHSGKDPRLKYGKTFCSRGCASKGSVTDYRRQKARETAMNNPLWTSEQSTESISRLLREREAYKYTDLDKALTDLNIKHAFEHVVDKYVYDLWICDKNILFEFDEVGVHSGKLQESIDKQKDQVAANNGYILHRIVVKDKTIDIKEVLSLLNMDKLT